MRRPGRPTIRKQDRRSVVFQMRLKNEEHERISAAANEKDTPPAVWARSVLLGTTKRILGKVGAK